MMTENKEIIDLGNKVKTKILPYERFIIVIVAICLIMKYFHFPFSGVISTFLLSSIGAIYFFSAFSAFGESDATGFDVFIYKLTGFASSVSIIGILFRIQHWPGYTNMLIIGLSILSISLIYMIFQINKKSELKIFDKWLVVRVSTLIIIAVGLITDKLGLTI